MKLELLLTVLLPVILANTIPHVPTTKTKLDDVVYTTNNTCFIAEYNIIDIHSPANLDKVPLIYFVQEDITNNINKGIYALHFTNLKKVDFHNVTITKLLDNGRCFTSDENNVYFGATDGIYTMKNGTTMKFGSITANIRSIQKVDGKDLIYIVTDDNTLFQVTENGNKITEHATIRNVHEIVIDDGNNLYFYESHEDAEKYSEAYQKYLKPKVLAGDRITEMTGLPDEYTHIRLGKFMGHSIALINNEFYFLHPNGTSSESGIEFLDSPTAFSIEWGLLQLYAKDKTMYCYTGLAEALTEVINEVMRQLIIKTGDSIKDGILKIANELRSEFS